MSKIKRPRFRQYFALHSNLVAAKDGVVVKVLEPFEIEVVCLVYNGNGEGCVEVSVRYKRPKGLKDAFNLDSVDDVKGITREEVLRVWKNQLLEL